MRNRATSRGRTARAARPGRGTCTAALAGLLALPLGLDAQAPAAASLRAGHACDGWFDRGVRLAGLDSLEAAAVSLSAAAEACPTAPALRELAGVRLRQGRTEEAAGLSRRALLRDPDDRHAAHTLATALYLDGSETEALAAWNRVGTPALDDVELQGLRRTNRELVLGLIGLEPGETLTPGRLATVRRRLSTLPVAQRTRADYRPRTQGRAELEVAVQERPVLFDDRIDWIRVGLRAIAGRELALDLAGPLGAGERWDARGRFSSRRPRWSVGVEAPLPIGPGGVWRLEGGWRRETYGATPPAPAGANGPAEAPAGGSEPPREDRSFATLEYGRWQTGTLRWEARIGWDRWSGRGDFLRVGGGSEVRLADERLALGAEASGWRSLAGSASFGAARVAVRGRTNAQRDGAVLHGRLELATATADAPLGLWAGAGTGGGRPWLARAHPLTHHGIVDGALFGRHLASGGLEAVRWLPPDVVPARLGFAAFADWATVAGRGGLESGPATQLDLGLGLRIAAPGSGGGFRLDVARGALDGKMAVSASWEGAWPDLF